MKEIFSLLGQEMLPRFSSMIRCMRVYSLILCPQLWVKGSTSCIEHEPTQKKSVLLTESPAVCCLIPEVVLESLLLLQFFTVFDAGWKSCLVASFSHLHSSHLLWSLGLFLCEAAFCVPLGWLFCGSLIVVCFGSMLEWTDHLQCVVKPQLKWIVWFCSYLIV